MKKLLSIISLLVVSLLIAPYFIGKNVETKYQDILNTLQKNNQFSVVEFKFNRDWFNGNATYTLVVPIVQPGGTKEIKIKLVESLNFGPVIFSEQGLIFGLAHSQANLYFNGELAKNNVTELISKNLNINSLITFSGDYNTNINMGAFTTKMDDADVIVKALSGSYSLINESHLVGDINWQGLTAQLKTNKLQLDTINITMDQNLVTGNIYDGTALFDGIFKGTVKNIDSSTANNPPTFKLTNFVVSGESKVTKDLMNILVNYHADEIFGMKQHFKQANLAIEVSNLNIKVLEKLRKTINNKSSLPPEQMLAENADKMLSIGVELLDYEPKITISDLSVVTEQGKIISDLQMRLDKKLFDPKNMQSLRLAAQVNAKGNGPVGFFQKMGLMPIINQYIQQGFLNRDQDTLSFKVNFEQGKLALNNKVLPL